MEPSAIAALEDGDLADKAGRRGDARDGEGPDGEGGAHERPAQASGQEDDPLVEGVDDGVEDRGRKAHRASHAEGEQDVADLAYRGVGHDLGGVAARDRLQRP